MIAAGTTCEDRLRLDGAGDGDAQFNSSEFDPYAPEASDGLGEVAIDPIDALPGFHGPARHILATTAVACSRSVLV